MATAGTGMEYELHCEECGLETNILVWPGEKLEDKIIAAHTGKYAKCKKYGRPMEVVCQGELLDVRCENKRIINVRRSDGKTEKL